MDKAQPPLSELTLPEIADRMQAAGLRRAFTRCILTLAQQSEGIADLMHLWAAGDSDRLAIERDLSEALVDRLVQRPTQYTLVGYKPDSDDYRMGHVLARYSSEDQLVCSTDPEPIAQAWAEMAATELESGEAPFQVTLLVGGSDVYDPNAPDIQAIHARRGVICTEIQEARRLKAEERQRLAAEIAARNAAEGERALLNRLLHKYHGTGN